jgi:hypothetical protein
VGSRFVSAEQAYELAASAARSRSTILRVQQFRKEGLVMKGGTQTALALGVGYVLGRRRKMRMTTALAAAAATGGLGTLGGMAVRRGVKMLGSTEALGAFAPQLSELAETLRGDLMDAGKAAASAAVSNRIESLTDSLHERAELVRNPGTAASEAAGTARSGAGKATETARSGAGRAAGAARSGAAGTSRRRRREEPRDEDESRYDEEEYADDSVEPEDYEAEAEEPEPDEPEPEEPRVARRRTSARRRSPVARAAR